VKIPSENWVLIPMGRKKYHLSDVEVNQYFINISKEFNQLSFLDIFGNSNPVEIEIGFGKGSFLVEQSSRNPNKNYLGIEKEKKYSYYTASRLIKRKITNCKLMINDASKILSTYILKNSIETIHTYFPDPWWKNRHQKRRIMSHDFLYSIINSLVPGGSFKFASDVPDYYFLTLKLMENMEGLCMNSASQESSGSVNSLRTNFEKKAFDNGNSVYQVTTRKSLQS